MSVNWTVLAPGPEGTPVLTYGNYGGPNYSGGQVVEPGQRPDFSVLPVDELDALFRQHDMVYSTSKDPLVRAQADVGLIRGIAALPDDALTPEGHLYAGLTILALTENIAFTNNHPELLTPTDRVAFAQEAVHHIQLGGIEPDATDLTALSGSDQLPVGSFAGIEIADTSDLLDPNALCTEAIDPDFGALRLHAASLPDLTAAAGETHGATSNGLPADDIFASAAIHTGALLAGDLLL